MSRKYDYLVPDSLREIFESTDGPPITVETLPKRRTAMAELFASLAPPAKPARTIQVPTGDEGRTVELRVLEPASRKTDGAIYAIHGGGYVVGTAAMMDNLNQQLANNIGCVVIAVDYRLAPETPFPGPLQDCFDGFEYVADNADALGINAAKLIVEGESAGGGLAAALCLMCRDRKAQEAVGQALVYPMLDHRTATPDDPDPNPTVAHYSWSRENNVFGWSAMRGGYQLDDARIGHFSPARAADLSGLPPAFVGTGALDLFLNEDIDYARRLSIAGVAVELHVYPGGPHGFQRISDLPAARGFRRDHLNAMRSWLGIEPDI